MDNIHLIILCYCLINSAFVNVESIKNYPLDKNVITEEDRRAAEKPEPDHQTLTTENYLQKSKKRGLMDYSMNFMKRPLASVMESGIGLRYKNKDRHFGFNTQEPTHYNFVEEHPYYLDSAHGHTYPAEHPSAGGGGYGNSGFGGHAGGGQFEYPAGGHSGIGQFGGFGDAGGNKKLALKKLLIPIAGIALLGAVAALTANPVLLQLGVLNGRRRRRDLRQFKNVYPSNHVVRPREN